MLEFQEDYYAILGVPVEASPEEIRKAYLKLAKKLHPDRFPNDPEKKAHAQVEFSRVTRAHEVLSDVRQREEYNALCNLVRSRTPEAPSEEVVAEDAPKEDDSGQPPSDAVAKKKEHKPEDLNSKEGWAAKNFTRGDECFRRQRYQEAEIALKEAIRLVPNKALYHSKLAEIYLARGWRTLAMTEVQAALKIDPKDAEAKQIEIKLKVKMQSGSNDKVAKKGLVDQLKNLLNKKI